MRPSSPHDAKASVARPYTLSKKSRYLVTLQFSLTSNSSVFKDRKKTVLPPASQDGGGSRIRTGGILLAKQTLYQLSYTPMSNEQAAGLRTAPGGLPPSAPSATAARLSPDAGGPDKSRTCDLVLIRDAL